MFMKPTVPETGKVIGVDRDFAIVLLQGWESCRKCGAAEIGLCKASGGVSTLRVRNTVNAVPGDTVKVGLDADTRRKGLLLAYLIPLGSFVTGTILGYAGSMGLSVPGLEVLCGFSSLIIASTFSLRKLKKLSSSSHMAIKEIVYRGYFGIERNSAYFSS